MTYTLCDRCFKILHNCNKDQYSLHRKYYDTAQSEITLCDDCYKEFIVHFNDFKADKTYLEAQIKSFELCFNKGE